MPTLTAPTVRRAGALAAGLLIGAAGAALLISGPTAAAAPTILEQGPWTMHRGDGPIDVAVPSAGDPSVYEHRNIPAIDHAGWQAPPLDDDGAILFSEPSQLAGYPCLGASDFTYFQTEVAVPADAAVTEFLVNFAQVDDGARAYVFNSQHPQGGFIEGGDIVYGGDPVTANLAPLVVAGEVNRVVIVQVDNCPMGNNLKGAALVVNGTVPTTNPALVSVTIDESAADPIADAAAAAHAVVAEQAATDGWFALQTTVDGAAKCLESNGVGEESFLGGASFADDCQDVTGQLWKVVDAGNGYFQLRSMLWDSDPLHCLEGNDAASEVLSGAAHMRPCELVAGQLWRFVDAGSGQYHLVTAFKENAGECLTVSPLASESPKGGAAHQTLCASLPGQLWTIAG